MRAKAAGINAYSDVIPTLNDAFHKGGAVLLMPTEGAAVRMVQRLNQYRILDRKLNYQSAIRRPLPDPKERPVEHAQEVIRRDRMDDLASMYDRLIFRRKGNEVWIEFRPETPYLEMRTLDGKLIHDNRNNKQDDEPIAPPPLDLDIAE